MGPVQSLDMPATSPTATTGAAPSVPARSLWGVCLALAKPRLTSLVLVTTGLGYVIAVGNALSFGTLFLAVIGTGLVAAAASALNQLHEARWDGVMSRTRSRPVPAGCISATGCRVYAALTAVSGIAILLTTHWLAALLALTSLVIYVYVYTPLKRRTTFNTVVGAVPGAIPPLIGWAAATGTLSPGAWSLFAILFLWQIPHFLAIAWLYREDYARAGFQMLPVVDPSGATTTRMVVVYQLALVIVSATPTFFGVAGLFYLMGAVLSSLAFLAVGVRMRRRIDTETARGLFFASLLYLPVILSLMVIDPVQGTVVDPFN